MSREHRDEKTAYQLVRTMFHEEEDRALAIFQQAYEGAFVNAMAETGELFQRTRRYGVTSEQFYDENFKRILIIFDNFILHRLEDFEDKGLHEQADILGKTLAHFFNFVEQVICRRVRQGGSLDDDTWKRVKINFGHIVRKVTQMRDLIKRGGVHIRFKYIAYRLKEITVENSSSLGRPQQEMMGELVELFS